MNKKTLPLTIALIIIPILVYARIQGMPKIVSVSAILPLKTGQKPTQLDTPQIQKNDRREPITIMFHASYVRMSLDELITESDLIVIGNLKTIHASRWNTPDGKRPEGDLTQGITPGKLIFTDMDFNVVQLIKGDAQQKKTRIRSHGGVVEGDRMVADKIIPEIGKTYLLFLDLGRAGSTDNIVTGHHWITGGGFQGMYEIVNGRAISTGDEWNLDELIAYIQNKLAEADSTVTPIEAPIEPSVTELPVEATVLPEETSTITPTP